MTYYLIMMMFMNGTAMTSTVTEYKSAQACRQAGDKAIEEFRGWNLGVKFVCTSDGDVP